MSDAASFDAVMQFNLLEVFCDALEAAFIVTDKFDEISFASSRLLDLFAIPATTIQPGARARDLYAALYDAGCRFGVPSGQSVPKKENWVSERVAVAWKERVDTLERCQSGRWFRVVSKRFSSGLGLIALQDVSDHKKKESQWRTEQERIRMTEHILDTLPVAIAIKDSQMHFAAVNEKFCTMMKAPPESILGRSVHGFFKPELSEAMDLADRQLLISGRDRQSIIVFDRPDGSQVTLLHRARRIGLPGQHYVSLSFEELPGLGDTGSTNAIEDLASHGGIEDGAGAVHLPAPETAPAVQPRRVIYVDPRGASPADLVDRAAADHLEICIVRNRREFAALLPALRAAGIRVDMVAIDSSGGPDYAAFSRQQGIPNAMLPAGAPILDGIRAALDGPATTPAGDPGDAPVSNRIDVLAVDDNALNRMVLEQIFESLGVRSLVVDCGREALLKLAELRPRLVFADMTLPDFAVEAWAPAIEAIFVEPRERPAVVGLMTAADQHRLASAPAAGFVHAICKPLSPEAIDLMLRKYLLHDTGTSVNSPKNAA